MRVRGRDGRMVDLLVGAVGCSRVGVGVRIPSLLELRVSSVSLHIKSVPTMGDGIKMRRASAGRTCGE